MAGKPSCRLVLLTLGGLEHRYVIRELVAAFPEALQAVILAEPPRRSFAHRLRVWWRRYTLREFASRVLAKGYQALRRHHLQRATAAHRILYDATEPPALPEHLVRRVASHNGRDCIELLDQIVPDVIAVYGTAMIRPPVIRRAKLAILNMHTGLSPYYRGADTVFWPLHDGVPEKVGVTIHLIDEGVDSGPILATGQPEIGEADDEHALFFKCVRVGTSLYVEAIKALVAGTSVPMPQQLDLGRSFRFVDRTLHAERRVERLLRSGLLRRYATGS